MLIDEADIFLEARDDKGGNVERNSLVTSKYMNYCSFWIGIFLIRVLLVFLKELEYFSGIVFLTTNRIALFDKAMKSRIYLALSYE